MRKLGFLPGLVTTALLVAAFQQGAAAPAEAAGSAEAPPRPLVLVAGATGRTGALVVAELQRRGYPVRAFVRNTAKAAERLGTEVEAVAGDLKDPASIAAALDGVGAVINAAGASGGGANNTPEKVDFEGARNLAEAAHAAGVNQYVLVSSRGVTVDDHPLNRRFNNVLIWKRRGEEAVAASGIDYTIVRPGGLNDEPGGRQTIVFEQGDSREQGVFIPRADVARVCVAALEHDAARNKTFEIHVVDGAPQADFGVDFRTLSGS